ncbi:MAG: TlyA family RNA methyltransferase [Chloroflexota bacterium]
MVKKRLDILTVERGLADSREKAQALILAGEVTVGGRVVDKPGTPVPEESELSVAERSRYASRGGLKLEHALNAFHVDPAGVVALDAGASTGGFTDCLLQNGAARVYAVDVGYGQLDWRLRNDPRVVNIERSNLRYMQPLAEVVDLATVDVSFISLSLVLPAIAKSLRETGKVVALVKPQFEAGRRQVGKGGVVRDPAIHREVLIRLARWASENGWSLAGATPSPILGPAGNREFFFLLRRGGTSIGEEELGLVVDGGATMLVKPEPPEVVT